jgi:hypothetical protein
MWSLWIPSPARKFHREFEIISTLANVDMRIARVGMKTPLILCVFDVPSKYFFAPHRNRPLLVKFTVPKFQAHFESSELKKA